MYHATEAEQSTNASNFVDSLGRVTVSECVPGVILFIKNFERVPPELFAESGLSKEGLRHPALVIRRKTSKPSHVLICPMTSFGGRSVQERYPHKRALRAEYLPVHPQSRITPGGVQLRTADLPLRKAGYVRTGKTYTVHTDMLRAYDYDFPAYRFRLTPASFVQVVQALGPRSGIPAAYRVGHDPLLDATASLQIAEDPRGHRLQHDPSIVQAPPATDLERASLLRHHDSPETFHDQHYNAFQPLGAEEAPLLSRLKACFATFAGYLCDLGRQVQRSW